MDENKLRAFHNHFSLVTIGNSKIPNFPWKKSQTEKLPWDDFLKNYNYKGGIVKKDGAEIVPTNGLGIITGFEDLEVIDVDLKVFSTAKEQRSFWEEFTQNLKDNILDFEDKFVIYKTRNSGFHILYKSKRVEGNLKLAKLKGHKEAIVETRGTGGYVFIYPENKVSKKSYFDIQYISDEDRMIVMSFAKMYDYKEPQEEIKIIPKPIQKEFKETEITPWDDFNNNTEVWDVISNEFSIISNQRERYVVKRNGAESPHSGYIFKDNNLLYLFSTGTIYPHETALSPFACFTWRHHNGDFSASAKDLYSQGFGSRIVKKEQEPKERILIRQDDLQFPLEIFPAPIQSYIVECKETLSMSVDYMGCSLLWLISLSIGNSMQMEVKRGWREIATLWIAVLGKPGIGKTPSISKAIFPVEKRNNLEISKYIKEYERFEAYEKMTKTEKESYPEMRKPKKTQFIANDITLEALVDLHQENDNAVGVFKDELAGWFKDMNKYKAGSDLEFWLSSWSGKSVNLNRMTRAGSFVSNPLISVLGGIQPGIFNSFATEENKDNGFSDRMLLCFPELEIEHYNDEEMDYNAIQWYNDTIVSFYESIKNKGIQRDDEGKIIPHIIKWNEESKKEWIRIFNEITDIQNSETENEYMKSMLPKQKSYIPRFALLIHIFNGQLEKDYDFYNISKESILKAEKLSKYFIAMAKKVKVDSIESNEIKAVINSNKDKTNKEKFEILYKANPDLNKKEASEQLGVSLQMIYKYLKDIK